jgi:hypothetical protein
MTTDAAPPPPRGRLDRAVRALVLTTPLVLFGFTGWAPFPLGPLFILGWLAAAVGVLIAALLTARRAPVRLTGPVTFWDALIAAVLLLFAVAIVVPTDVHTRSAAQEAATLGDVRTMISAQTAYQSSNRGFFDTPECLATPHRCLPGYPATAPTFLDSRLGQTTLVKDGYRRVFHPGAPAEEKAVRAGGVSASSLTCWAYVAVPLVPGRSGSRAFCGDATGRICSTPSGQTPAVKDGLCADSCPGL